MSVNNIITGLATLFPLVRGTDAALFGGNPSVEKIGKLAIRSLYDAALYFGSAFAGGWIANQALNFGAKVLSLSTNSLAAKIGAATGQILLAGLIAWGINSGIRFVAEKVKIDPAPVIG